MGFYGLGFAVRALQRDLRSGDLTLLIFSIVLAVAALTSVGFFSDRLQQGLERDAHQLLGADLVLRADNPLPAIFYEQAAQLRLETSQTVAFPTMVQAADHNQLVALKAVGQGYPLRGQLTVRDTSHLSYSAKAIPSSGEAWVDEAVLQGLDIVLGQTLQLGEKTFQVTRVIELEPDRGAAFMNFAPRIMIHLDDLAATGLIQPGSRATYRMLLAGHDVALHRYQQWLETDIKKNDRRGIRIDTLAQGRPEMRETLDRAARFLSLVAMLSAWLSGLAIVLAVRRFAEKRTDSVAVLRCLGMRQTDLVRIFVFEFLCLGVLASMIGAGVGWVAHFVLIEAVSRLLQVTLPLPTWQPLLTACCTGLLMLIGFGLPPILQLSQVTPLRVLRRDMVSPTRAASMVYGFAVILFGALMIWQAKDFYLGLLTTLGFVGAWLLFVGLAWCAVAVMKRLLPYWPTRLTWLRVVTQAVTRRSLANIVQIASLSLGLMALLLLTLVRTDLIEGWHQHTPPDAPNRFVINIQPDQTALLTERLKEAEVKKVTLYPMIRGRLVAINQRPTQPHDYTDERAKGLVTREFNLSYSDTLPAENQLIQGQWFAPQPNQMTEVSVEAGLAKTLELKLGDVLRFDIAGQTVDATITSLRKLDWSSMRVNFFVIFPSSALHAMPQTYITAFYLAPDKIKLVQAWLRDFPNLTIMDVGALLKQVQNVLDQVILAVEFLFLFTLLSGALVLYTGLIATRETRIKEAGLLRALGASRGYLARLQLGEFALIGLLSGLLAALAASVLSGLLAVQVFEFEWRLNFWIWPAGMLLGAGVALIGAWIGLRSVLQTPPWVTLRESVV